MAKMPKYRLQTLFELREREKEKAEEAYAKEQKRVNTEKKKLEEMKNKLEQMKQFRKQKRQEYMQQMRTEMLTIEKIQINNLHIKKLKADEEAFVIEISKQQEVLAKAQEDLKVALDEMLKATQQFKALEKHKEKWLQQEKKKQLKKEEDEADDISQAQYFSRHKE